MQDPLARIRVLEAQLAENPDDADAYFILGYLYENFGRDDAKAKFNYLNYLVRAIGYPDVQTAIASLEEKVTWHEDDLIAHVYLGQIYGYQNRFEEAEAQVKRGTVWMAVDSEHYRLHVIPGSTAHQAVEKLKQKREEGLTKILDFFQLPYSRAERIVYFFYESPLHKGLITGDQMLAHAFTARGEVHVVYNQKTQVDGLHEDAHIILRPLGRPCKLLEEGTAEYIQRSDRVHAWYLRARASRSPCRIAELIDDAAFQASDLFLTYPLAASFVGFLIQRRGVETFKQLYCAPAVDMERSVQKLYGQPLAALEADWRAFLASLPAPDFSERSTR